MKSSYFQQEIEGRDACRLIIMKATKGCGKISLNDTLFSDSWFSGVKTEEEVNTEGINFCGTLKTSHEGFFLAMLEKLMK